MSFPQLDPAARATDVAHGSVLNEIRSNTVADADGAATSSTKDALPSANSPTNGNANGVGANSTAIELGFSLSTQFLPLENVSLEILRE